MRDALQAAEEAAAIAECDLVAARRCLEKADKLREQLHEELLAAATSGWKLDDEAYAELKAHRAELNAVWEKHMAMEAELRQEYTDAQLHAYDTKFEADEARHDLAAHRQAAKREVEMKAELKVARAAEHAERRAAADEAERLRRHRELMDFYDTMTPEELQRYVQMQGRIRNEERNKGSPPPRLARRECTTSAAICPRGSCLRRRRRHRRTSRRRRRRRSHHQSQPRRRLALDPRPRCPVCAAPFGSPERPRAWTGACARRRSTTRSVTRM